MSTQKDRIVIVTGAAQRMGHAIPFEGARQGPAWVTRADIEEDEGAAVTAQVETAGAQGQFITIALSVTEPIRHMIEETARRVGGIDVLNHAGVTDDDLARCSGPCHQVLDACAESNANADKRRHYAKAHPRRTYRK